MNRLSIKMRVTLWYALLMLVLATLVLGFTIYIAQNVEMSSSNDNLIKVVSENAQEVEFDRDELDVDDDFAYSKNGVTCVIYSADGGLLFGQTPHGFSTNEPLQTDSLRSVKSADQTYYIYDIQIGTSDNSRVWVRGIALANNGSLATIIIALAILLPLIMIIAIGVGYFISKRAFKPVEKITAAANAISSGNDLSRRINLEQGKDEICKLAHTFDNMFARLELAFEKEKRFTSDASHELRTPTSVIIAQCEYALEHAADEQEYTEALETILRQANRMSNMISQLLSFTRLDQGTQPAKFESCNLSALVQSVCLEHGALAQEASADHATTIKYLYAEHNAVLTKNISIITNIAPNIYATIDQSLMSRLLDNLIANAYKYGRDQGCIWVNLDASPSDIKLSVADNGIGIAPENLGKIFDRFYQVDSARLTDDDSGVSVGVGLGLSMVQQIAQMHNGHIAVQSTLGTGSVLTLTLPVQSQA